ncbi:MULTISPECIES: 4-alpha-glucanotransferase [unclassified Cupriavidus]|uniref:4-alpha-glucanotransferase n=1 Tax=unclassified Cupriavidus TaxID=2640874 RepID=UPI001C007090|nr:MULTISPECIES: 4-alpha-glucanotransferase [unclassified Cupriavidus]MCA3183539.1 4-alpha-glucanotransferase [Cupriavidus sp.]MCA3188713.1 4-alpha-glucanotransferase [Cupriavidus sp.]MCA3199729.1 4-alpha-glucanotransferase [Cupriavidus sp.]MCA3205203.1 4-alpha-glucanotransferase [Cupriavidus sp.]MCA3205815.1 4-alpha-glucanotransferase [Cupriavidus sp.]
MNTTGTTGTTSTPGDGDPLRLLAERAGLQVHWRDAWNQPQTLSSDALRTVLTAMDLPCATPGECEASRARLAADDGAHALPPLITADQGKPVVVPWAHTVPQRPYRLECEDGTIIEGVAQRTGDGTMAIAPISQWGYHHLLLGDVETTVAVAPPRCYGMADALAASPRPVLASKPWGLSVQLYGLRRGADTGLGDLTTLALTAEAAARAGADAIAINPLHAGFPALPERFSPYSPSSRIFFNPLYADPARVFGQAAVDQAVAELGIGAALADAERRTEIDWPALARVRLQLLRWLWDRHDTLLPAAQKQAFAAFRARGGKALLAHATFEAIQAEQLRAATDDETRRDAADWRRWPATLRSPDGAAAMAMATTAADAIGYHAFLQWLAADGLDDAQQRARAAGMAVGVIADLAVGTDPGGSHAWTRQAEVLNGFHAGAPPDLYNPLGQDWGVAVFSPRGLRRNGYAAFIEMLRANLAHAGGLRIDHVLGLARMWLVPEGSPASAGAYLTYPLDDLLRLVAIESWRHRAIIVGENLGTVPETLNTALEARGVLGIDVLWFVREEEEAEEDTEENDESRDGAAAVPPAEPASPAFLPPESWPAQAVATTTTHDLPTIAGWWSDRDIAWRARLDQLGASETEDGLMASRAAERTALWQAMCDGGVARGAEPPADTAPVEAILRWLHRASAPLRLVPVEDMLALREQPNLPGTVSGHPNWQRRLEADPRHLFTRPDVTRRVAAVRDGENGEQVEDGRDDEA